MRAARMLRDREEDMILGLARAIEYRDSDTGEHTLRVALHSRMIAAELGLSEAECRDIYLAAPLHDIGKVAVPDHILLKPGPLTGEEAIIMRSHAVVGEQILGDSASELMRLAAKIAGHHHERWDGTGYPGRLAGAAIPFGARIVAVADAFDAMTTDRPYKAAIPPSAALDVLAAERGRHFDPRCLDAFLAGYGRLRPEAAGERQAHAGPPRARRIRSGPRHCLPTSARPRRDAPRDINPRATTMNQAPPTRRLNGDAMLARADAVHADLLAMLSPGEDMTLDLSTVAAADLSFVQLLVSVVVTAKRAGGSVALTGVSEEVRRLIEQAGVGFDPAAGRLVHA